VLLVQPGRQFVKRHYNYYRYKGASVFAALLSVFLVVTGWIFFRLESPSWQWVLKNRTAWFWHINTSYNRVGDMFRYLLQGVWLLMVIQNHPKNQLTNRIKKRWARLSYYYNVSLNILPKHLQQRDIEQTLDNHLNNTSKWKQHLLVYLGGFFSILLALICIFLPLTPINQLLFALFLVGFALIVRRVPGRIPQMILIILSLTISCRYLSWRYTATINWDDWLNLICGGLLLFAESYAVLVLFLGYLQTLWPLKRQPAELPADTRTWPTIDWLITTYNEDLSIVKPSVYGALGVDWPKDKINIYLLDDGNRPAFKQFADEVGIHYIARPSHEHAKAGNLNYALQRTSGDYVAIFDCDHVPTHIFLEFTMGWFLKDPKLAILQTPHHFFSPDPFERNLKNFRQVPNESLLFYGLIQDGNDTWNATYFCGSCGILRRTALETIGGIAVDTVTEDTHTSLRIQRQGYTSAYIRVPLAAGMATVNLASHIGQRIRWARGMVQIFRLDNPLLGKGLTLAQRLCYTNSILHFLSGIPRLIFLTAPLAFLFLHAYIIYAPALIILIYALPHLFHAILTNSSMQGKFRYFFWGEFYETVLAWYITWPTTVALISPHRGTFNVTPKGELIENQHVDWLIARPYLVLFTLNLLGILVGLYRLFVGPEVEITTVLINMVWTTYNMVILAGALAVVVEAKQIRTSHRVPIQLPAAIARNDGHLFPCTLKDYSDVSVGIEMMDSSLIKEGDEVFLLLKRDTQEYSFACQVTRTLGRTVGIRLTDNSVKKQIEFIQCTFARADAWASSRQNFSEDKPLESFKSIMTIGVNAYINMMNYSSPLIRKTLLNVKNLYVWIASFIPRNMRDM
jgi:cellulose synthase (UDP-forming)